MGHVSIKCLGYLLLIYVTLVSAVPSFDIDLDQPPEKRWVGVAKYYKPQIIDQLEKLIPLVNPNSEQDSWINGVAFDDEYSRELQGIVDTIKHPGVTLERLKWLNMLYEMDSPMYQTGSGCSGVLWARQDGTVMHGRNMDDFGEDTKLVNWQAMTFEVTMHRNRKPLIKMTQWPGEIGVHTGMRFGDQVFQGRRQHSHRNRGSGGGSGWSFQQNTRDPNNWQDNLLAAGRGGQIFQLAARRIMEETADYQTAMQLLQSSSFAAPQYFVIGGSEPYQGTVLTIERLAQNSVVPAQHVSQGDKNWYVVQTNDDITGEAKDDRRPLANFLMEMSTRDIANNEDNLLQFMHTKEVFNDHTIFSTVMVPATGYYKTVLPNEAPNVVDGSAIKMKLQSQAGGGQEDGWFLNQKDAKVEKRAPRKRGFLEKYEKYFTHQNHSDVEVPVLHSPILVSTRIKQNFPR